MATKKSSIAQGLSQGHGKSFETQVKQNFQGSSDEKRSPTSAFDIEGKFDKDKGLPTQVKACKVGKGKAKTIVCMADARRQSKIAEPFRMVVVEWEQKSEHKHAKRVVELIFKNKTWKNKVFVFPEKAVRLLHEKIARYGPGSENTKAARLFAKNAVKALKEKYKSIVGLNPKIGEKDNQRRLQCSAALEDLITLADEKTIFEKNKDTGAVGYEDASVGVVKSESRKLRRGGP